MVVDCDHKDNLNQILSLMVSYWRSSLCCLDLVWPFQSVKYYMLIIMQFSNLKDLSIRCSDFCGMWSVFYNDHSPRYTLSQSTLDLENTQCLETLTVFHPAVLTFLNNMSIRSIRQLTIDHSYLGNFQTYTIPMLCKVGRHLVILDAKRWEIELGQVFNLCLLLVFEICSRLEPDNSADSKHSLISRVGIRSCRCTDRSISNTMNLVSQHVLCFSDTVTFPNVRSIHLLGFDIGDWKMVSPQSRTSHQWNWFI